MELIDKSALVAEIENWKQHTSKCGYVGQGEYEEGNKQGRLDTCEKILSFFDTLEVKEIDLELITHWFDHIAQIADDRKTANGTVMEDWAALDEIKCLAKNSSEFIKMHYKAQKGE